jgi:hypothetical protein
MHVLITLADGTELQAAAMREPARIVDWTVKHSDGWKVSAGNGVSEWMAECIAYGLNEGPQDKPYGSFDHGDDMPACTWRLVQAAIRTADGYLFLEAGNGEWTDGDQITDPATLDSEGIEFELIADCDANADDGLARHIAFIRDAL